MAQGLARRGYSTLAIDELGYGASDHPNGYRLTVQSYAAITDQIVRQLRAGRYGIATGRPAAFTHVGLMGHSAGSEIVELAAGIYHDADVVIPTSYEHTPTGVSATWLAREWVPGDNVRAAKSDYEYFETNPRIRAADMYNLALADPEVVRRDTAAAHLTPSGEIFSIGSQPSRAVVPRISAPVLLVVAQNDALFPPSGAAAELALFASAKDRTAHVVPGDGHVFSLHPNAPQTTSFIAQWLDARQAAMPHC